MSIHSNPTYAIILLAAIAVGAILGYALAPTIATALPVLR